MRKTHLTSNQTPQGKDWSSHMKSIGHEFQPKTKAIRRQAEKRHTGHLKALINKMK